jgi:unsaturated rhamnogalacturonyl hydrolase
MHRRTVIGGLAAGAGLLASGSARASAGVGARAANAYLGRPDFMMYEVGEVKAVHYAEVASAYGAARLAAATGDEALFARVADRHRRLLDAHIGNTANHVDANVYGAWPLELYRRTRDRADLERGLALADSQWRDPRPDGLSAQSRFWIDDIWMIGALQLQAWRATADPRYLDRAAHTAQAYVERLQQPNGLIHHGPDAPFFWGRGNGWVAAGLAEVLSELPSIHPRFAAVQAGYRRMMAALLRHQAPDGMWRQLVDDPDAWKETSATAMFGFAMTVGVQRGLLRGGAYGAAADRAWKTLASYVGEDGQVSDVCVGTGQSREAAYYLNRPRTTGDLHGQAPVMWFAAARAGAWGSPARSEPKMDIDAA